MGELLTSYLNKNQYLLRMLYGELLDKGKLILLLSANFIAKNFLLDAVSTEHEEEKGSGTWLLSATAALQKEDGVASS